MTVKRSAPGFIIPDPNPNAQLTQGGRQRSFKHAFPESIFKLPLGHAPFTAVKQDDRADDHSRRNGDPDPQALTRRRGAVLVPAVSVSATPAPLFAHQFNNGGRLVKLLRPHPRRGIIHSWQ